jgi:hypothetical protein
MKDEGKTKEQLLRELRTLKERLAKLERVEIERKRAEEALRESEEKFRDLAERSLVGVYLIQDEIFKYVNPRLAEIFGYTVEELIDKKGPENLVLPEDWPIVKENLRKRISGEIESIRYAFKGLTKNKKIIYVEVYGSRTVYRGGPAVIGTLLDITERKQAEETVLKEMEKAQRYLDIAGVMFIALDSKGKVTLVNKKGCEILECPEDEIIGKNWFNNFIPERSRKDVKEVFDKLMRGEVESVEYFENLALTKSGEERLISWHNSFLKDDGSNITGILSSGEDITERKRAEDALKEAYEELKSLDELKSDIIANVSHELRTPITIVRGALEMVMEEKRQAEREILLKMALGALARQNAIVGDLIEATKIRGGKKLKLGPVDLNDAVTIVSSEFEPIALRNKVKIRIDLDKNLPLVKANFEGLLYILRNLLSNATKFNKEGGKVTITAREKEGMVEVCVSDTGIGIPEDALDRIFDRFYQVDSSPGRRYSGTGMGLAIVKDMVEAHGGEIRAKSKLDKGSKFCFTLLTRLE